MTVMLSTAIMQPQHSAEREAAGLRLSAAGSADMTGEGRVSCVMGEVWDVCCLWE